MDGGEAVSNHEAINQAISVFSHVMALVVTPTAKSRVRVRGGGVCTMVAGKIVVSEVPRLQLKTRYPANNNFHSSTYIGTDRCLRSQKLHLR